MQYRQAMPSDAPALFAMMCALDHETDCMLYEPGERGDDPAHLLRILEGMHAAHDFFMLATNDEGEIMGFLSAGRGSQRRVRHSAYLVMGIRAACRNQGVGAEMFGHLDQWARKSGVTRLELTVLCDNPAAIHLYEKVGFVKEGVKVHSILDKGRYRDEYCMAKLLN